MRERVVDIWLSKSGHGRPCKSFNGRWGVFEIRKEITAIDWEKYDEELSQDGNTRRNRLKTKGNKEANQQN